MSNGLKDTWTGGIIGGVALLPFCVAPIDERKAAIYVAHIATRPKIRLSQLRRKTMSKPKAWWLLTSIVIVGLLLTACGGGAPAGPKPLIIRGARSPPGTQ